MTRQNITVGLDIGTTKISVVAADWKRESVDILGTGTAPSAGLKKGIVVNIDATVESIRKAVKEAESSAGIRIKSASVGISGGHIKGFESSGAVGIKGRGVTGTDVRHAIESARAVYVPLDREVLHVIPTEFVLDGQEGITDPEGMSGVRLEAKVYIITCAVSPMENLMKCCEKAGIEVAEMVFSPVASAYSTLTAEEKNSGVILLDIGGGTTDIALLKEGSIRYVSVLGVGGNHFTNDVAVGLRVNAGEAERLKRTHGAAYEALVKGAEEIEIRQGGGESRRLPRKYVAEILQPRCEEVLELIKEEIKKSSGYETAICGVVLTGGASLLSGLDKMAESVLGLPVRQGAPRLPGGDPGPGLSTGIGLAAYGFEPEAADVPRPGSIKDLFVRISGAAKNIFGYSGYSYLNLIGRKEGGVLCLRSKK